jgi:hypothetical protein
MSCEHDGPTPSTQTEERSLELTRATFDDH